MTKAAEKAIISRRERHPPHPIVAGEKFHRLTVIEKIVNRPGSYWRFKCECGNDVIATSSAVRRGNNKSCGCLKSENAINKNKTHGLSHLPEYKVWTGMSERCLNPKSAHYSNYGGRGIQICKRWRKFENFFADMGSRPSRLYSLDRIDCDGDYAPSNCRWATRGEQNRNQRRHRLFEINGKKLNMIDVSKETGISMTSIQRRLKRGLAENQAISSKDYRKTPKKRRFFLVNGKKISLIEAARAAGVTVGTIQRRLKRGLSEEQALSRKDYRRDSI